MVNFHITFFCSKTNETKIYNLTHPNFASAASWAYVEKQCLFERTGEECLVNLSEKGGDIQSSIRLQDDRREARVKRCLNFCVIREETN